MFRAVSPELSECQTMFRLTLSPVPIDNGDAGNYSAHWCVAFVCAANIGLFRDIAIAYWPFCLIFSKFAAF